ncbi:hypothetical protein LPJ78_004000 [Coemansia sp. RSA 989]|nr:cyclin-like protein [Coemansia mojavensis]KAJ1741204.1 hypothetical protein LPJ68_003081 [Coemansia sp. RSA 1086]KAJ1749437.1 hypothetical protein LPJ79_003705 [Coemansia sp. RSA 1821]KAJ1863482.1 hypothetical protein LPJ78_004000 [Coemansia sp. RSA 989]KAJ1871381.1 hypothetical protein LPJ55_003917 [Coemansia sp. RSA 990]KAJ2669570.1 hypothetical protein IWW42_004522 [Coemansia sp. RSA 1085]
MASAEETRQLPQLFEQTSQYRHWRFTPEALEQLRAANNQQGIDRVLDGLGKEVQVEGSSETRITEATNNMLTPQEELQLVNYYLQMIVQTITALTKTYREKNLLRAEAINNIKATAINFMKRFYLHNVVFDYPPKTIMFTCLYLATKVENSFMKIEDFIWPLQDFEKRTSGQVKTKNDDILGYEFVVIQSLQFELAVHHPYRPAYGFFLDMQAYFDDISQLKTIYDRAQQLIGTSLFTDLVFFYQPSQIALGALKTAAKEKDIDIDMYLAQRFDAQSLEVLFPILDEIQETILGFKIISKKNAQAIDRKLILCRNPEKNPNSKLYKKKVADQEEMPYVSDSD